MSELPTGVNLADAYTIEPRNKFFGAIRAVAEFEVRPGPTYTFVSQVDLTEIEAVRRAAGKPAPSYTAFVAKAVALALREFPYANRRVCRPPSRLWLVTRLQTFKRCDIAVASERDVPGAESVAFYDVFRDVDQQSLQALTQGLRELATSDIETNAQWRSFSSLVTRLPQWLSTLLIRLPYFFPRLWLRYRGAAVLISSPAKYGVDAVMASQSFPLAVAFGLAKLRPVVRGDQVVPCMTFTLSVNVDRRIMAGAKSARFYKRIIELLEQATTTLAPPGQA